MKWYIITYYLVIGGGIIIGLVRYKSLAKSSRVLVLLLFATLATELIASLLSGIKNYSLFIYALFQPIEFSLITYTFYCELRHKHLLKTIPIYVVFVLINGLWIQPIQSSFATYPIIVTSIVTSIWVLLYLRKILEYPTKFNLYDFVLFWYSTGLLLFNVVAIFGYGPFNYIGNHVYEIIGPAFRVIRIIANHLLYIMVVLTLLSKQKSFYAAGTV